MDIIDDKDGILDIEVFEEMQVTTDHFNLAIENANQTRGRENQTIVETVVETVVQEKPKDENKG